MGDAIDTDKDGNPLTVEDVISDDRDIVEEIETKRRWLEVKKLIENMDDEREKEIIILRYGLNNALMIAFSFSSAYNERLRRG